MSSIQGDAKSVKFLLGQKFQIDWRKFEGRYNWDGNMNRFL